MLCPLAYQLDPKYPYFPQKLLASACESLGSRCVDLLPSLRAHPAKDIFRLDQAEYHDVWQFTLQGHDVVARHLATQL